MELNGFMIGPEIKKLFKIKVDTPTAGHPVDASLDGHRRGRGEGSFVLRRNMGEHFTVGWGKILALAGFDQETRNCQSTDRQEIAWARLRESSTHQGVSHAT